MPMHPLVYKSLNIVYKPFINVYALFKKFLARHPPLTPKKKPQKHLKTPRQKNNKTYTQASKKQKLKDY